MLRKEKRQLSFHSSLYEMIPKNHILKQIDETVDFGFVNDLLKESYCENFGRPAKEPEMMMRLLFLQYLYSLSDVRLTEEASCNLAYKWFLGLNPEDELPDASLLAKFRTQRLKEDTLDNVLTEIVRQCVNKGLIKGAGLSIDTTHTEANCTRKTPERLMKHMAKRIFEGLKEDAGEIPAEVDTDIPDYKAIKDPAEAKRIMLLYIEKAISQSEPFAGEKALAAIKEAREVLSDEKFILQKGVRSLSDKDARVGHKTKTDKFFGYKSELMMTTDERIITAAAVHSGEYVDGIDFDRLLERTQKSGIALEELYGDKAYFRANIIEGIEKAGATAYIPVSASAYRIDEEKFSYNKDSDRWLCFMGNHTVSKKRAVCKRKDREPKEYDRYMFDASVCTCCSKRQDCMGSQKGKSRILDVSLSTPLLYEYSRKQKTPEFKEKYKSRSCIEWKNGEMKRFHGMSRARGSGLKALSVQIKLTAIAVNLKRIAAIMNEKAANSAPDSSIANRFFSIIEHSFKAFRISTQIGRQNTGLLMPAV
jgi:transposase